MTDARDPDEMKMAGERKAVRNCLYVAYKLRRKRAGGELRAIYSKLA